jgi:hypothetical protein
MDEEKKIAEIKKKHSLQQKPLTLTGIKRKYTYDKKTNEIFHSRFNKISDDVMREIYKIAFTQCFHEIRTITRLEVLNYIGEKIVYFDWLNHPQKNGWKSLKTMNRYLFNEFLTTSNISLTPTQIFV